MRTIQFIQTSVKGLQMDEIRTIKNKTNKM